MGYFGWAPYVSVAERRKKAEKAAAKATKSGASLSPVAPYRGAIAKTFWGKAWCDNLEAYSDYANRMPRGRTYVRNGSVIDLAISAGRVQALVVGSSLYKVAVTVHAVPQQQWQAIGADCSGSIDSLVELLQGKLSSAVMQRICTPRTGLFPAPKEISFSCSCPDSASMCKHIAAVLYGVGARLDQKPELLFSLRQVDAKDLVRQAGAGLAQAKTGLATSKVLGDAMLADVFGIEMDDGVDADVVATAGKAKVPAASSKPVPAKAAGRAKKSVPLQAAAPAKEAAVTTKAAKKKKATKKSVPVRPAAPAKKAVVEEKAAAKKTVVTTAVAKSVVAQHTVEKKGAKKKQAVVQKTVAKKAVVEKAVSKRAVVEKVVVKKPVAEKTVAKKAVPEKSNAKPVAAAATATAKKGARTPPGAQAVRATRPAKTPTKPRGRS